MPWLKAWCSQVLGVRENACCSAWRTRDPDATVWDGKRGTPLDVLRISSSRGDDKCSLSARADETAVSRHYEPLSHAPESASVPHSISCLQSAGYAVLLVSRHSPWPRRSFHGCAPQKHESISSALTSGDRSRTGGSLWPLWPTCRRMRTLSRAQ